MYENKPYLIRFAVLKLLSFIFSAMNQHFVIISMNPM